MTGQVSGDDAASRGKQGRTDRRAARVAQNRSWAGGNSGWGTHLVLRTVCAASSSLENFLEGPNMRAPPCSSCPLAGAQVGLCAVVIGRALCPDLWCDLNSGDAHRSFFFHLGSDFSAFLATFRKGEGALEPISPDAAQESQSRFVSERVPGCDEPQAPRRRAAGVDQEQARGIALSHHAGESCLVRTAWMGFKVLGRVSRFPADEWSAVQHVPREDAGRSEDGTRT